MESEGMNTADCVHRTRKAILEDRRKRGLDTHPFHWAGFVAMGSAR
ncbi:MAG: hypothetical protein QGG33_02860 [Candidatus Krumholzibacteria bacterium]|nr:hypothetical protein [Candidatus Krumholzibacteria bacterium]